VSEEKNKLLQFLQFALVGVSNAVISWIVYAACICLGLHYLPATGVGFTVSMFNATFWNRRVVFRNEGQSWWRSFVKTYIAYSITALFLNALLLHLWVDAFCLGEYLAPASRWLTKKGIPIESGRRLVELTGPFFNYCITVPLNYFLNKCWAFGRPAAEDGDKQNRPDSRRNSFRRWKWKKDRNLKAESRLQRLPKKNS
jgi:putative flippase GtrA